MNENNWQVFSPQKETYLKKYKTRKDVLIVGKGTGKKIYLTDAVIKNMGNPEWVELRVRGTNIGIAKSPEDGRGFKVSVTGEATFRWINAISLIKTFNLKTGVYDCHWEGGMLVFDHLQNPAVL